MKKAIVTGATGFIGKFLVRELVKQNVEVIAVVRRGTKNLNTINALPVKIVECNIADYHMLPDMIADRDIDVVFHIAWQGVSDLDARNEAIQMQNLQSTLDLIDARLKRFLIRGCSNGKDREKKKCNEKYYIWRYFKSVSNCSAFFNAYGYDLFHGCPVSWLEFAFYVNSSGIKFG